MMTWNLGPLNLHSRLLLGSAGYPNLASLEQSLINSGCEIATIAIRRVNTDEPGGDIFLNTIRKNNIKLLPNTAGCYTAKDAVLMAQLACEAFQTDWVKLEVIGDTYTLYPDAEELLKAARELISKKINVLPYCTDDPILCRKLEDMGCLAVMPLGAPIGSGQGIRNPQNIELIVKQSKIPVIVDAGVGTASHAAFALELGCDGVLMNTAIAKAKNPPQMALAMKQAVEAGRNAFEAGRIPERKMATPSTTPKGLFF
ncbi:MAG: hypothetical protein ACD_73C00579G0002 [uncultured bacterium]|nr:MAG: hypothetical protein ACD_73C00579G0002 [uncultured bacterium]